MPDKLLLKVASVLFSVMVWAGALLAPAAVTAASASVPVASSEVSVVVVPVASSEVSVAVLSIASGGGGGAGVEVSASVLTFTTYYGYGCPSWSHGATAHAYDIWGTSLDSVTFVFWDGAVSYAPAYYQGGGHFTASTSYPFSSVHYLYFNYHNPPGGHSEWLQCY